MGNTEENHARTFFALPAMPIRMTLTRARTTILTRKTRARMLVQPPAQATRKHFASFSSVQKKPLVQDMPKAPTNAGAFDANTPRLPSGETEKDGQIHSARHLLAFHPGGFHLGMDSMTRTTSSWLLTTFTSVTLPFLVTTKLTNSLPDFSWLRISAG